ncbi:LysR family transcriptional regulator [Alcaligenes sp. MMA]|uniref:LysR family transcriptional regulator n=1 Tax=Alcaligenes sp. MMA TaxID=2893019 RepID=UPI001E430E26|nr:LysR family transcriptional regulator [Alcaligenes sp. MMA]MCC9162238.1 LysR family transcriptional regulator [Alcaligenes sp. MMA]
MKITIKQLEHFVAAAQTGQVSRAAQRCYVSQPSLTTSLKNLESFLGVQLFSRHSAGLRLTLHGERFLRHAEHILASLDMAVAETKDAISSVEGSVKLAITDTVSEYMLPKIIGAMRRQLPQVSFEPVERNRLQIEHGVRDGEFDLAVVLISNLTRRSDLKQERLLKSERRLWTALDHPLAAQSSVSLRELSDQAFILLDMDEHVATVNRYWSAAKLKPKVVFRTKSIEAVRSLVAQNVGVTILSDLVFRPWSHDGGRIRRTAMTGGVPSMDLGLIYRHEAQMSKAAQACANTLRLLAKSVLRESHLMMEGNVQGLRN